MTNREIMQQALDALLHMCNTTKAQNDYNAKIVDKALVALEAALAQPEFDTPDSHIVKWSIPADPNNFGKPLAQPEPVGFYVYKPVLPQGVMNINAENLPWVYDQAPSSGYMARMFVYTAPPNTSGYAKKIESLIKERDELRQALAQPEQKPVALKMVYGEVCYQSKHDDQSFGMWCPITEREFPNGTPFYTAPPKREWVGLTVEEIRLMAHNDDKGDWNDLRFRSCWHNGYVDGVNAANAKLKELNK